jgi:hypothetical protein
MDEIVAEVTCAYEHLANFECVSPLKTLDDGDVLK